MSLEVWEAIAFDEQQLSGGRTKPVQLLCQLEANGKRQRVSCVVKAVGHPEIRGVTELAYELMGYRVASLFGCVTPEARLVYLSPEFIAANHEAYGRLGFMPEPGIAFGSDYMDNMTPIFPHPRPQPKLFPQAAVAYALDMAIQNVDRRIDKTNCAVGPFGELVLFDFEKAFTFCEPFLLSAPDAWDVKSFGFQKQHVFYSWLQAQPIDWAWLDHCLTGLSSRLPAVEDFPAGWYDHVSAVRKHFDSLSDHAADYQSSLTESLR